MSDATDALSMAIDALHIKRGTTSTPASKHAVVREIIMRALAKQNALDVFQRAHSPYVVAGICAMVMCDQDPDVNHDYNKMALIEMVLALGLSVDRFLTAYEAGNADLAFATEATTR